MEPRTYVLIPEIHTKKWRLSPMLLTMPPPLGVFRFPQDDAGC